MIKVIIFDLDGVLVDTKLIHFLSLNKALDKYNFDEISLEDHTRIFDGLPTLAKLQILNKKKLLNKNYNIRVNNFKQKITKKIIKEKIFFDKNKYKLFKVLSKKYKIVIATNAVRSTLNACIDKLRISKFVDYSICNEDVNKAKPNPEIFFRIFIKYGIFPNEALILEDSHYGRLAASSSGSNLMPVKELEEVNLKNINNHINAMENSKIIKKIGFWEDKNLNILIPMAGAGKRFQDAGYTFPKPLIEVNNKPMIQLVLESLNLKGKYIFIIQKEHQEKFNIKSMLKILQPECKIIEIDSLTEGAACTTLLAQNYINNNDPLIIANSDQYVVWNSSKCMYEFNSKNLDGAILTFESVHPKWSYARCDNDNFVLEVAEKKVISKNATAGVYYWKKGSDYVKYAKQMIKKNIRVNNEFYVCPVYNEAIKCNKKIKIKNIEEMHGLGTPEDLKIFLKR